MVKGWCCVDLRRVRRGLGVGAAWIWEGLGDG